MKRLAIFVLAVLFAAGCRTTGSLPDPVENKISAMGFVPLRSPSTTPILGFAFDGAKQLPDTDECFRGDLSLGSQFDSYVATYTATASPGLAVVLKNLVTLRASGVTNSTVTVSFANLQETTLSRIKPTLAATCATDRNVYVTDQDIVVSVLKSSETYVSASQGHGSTLSIAVATPALSGLSPLESAQAARNFQSGSAETLIGRNLNIGYKTARYTATEKEATVDLDMTDRRSARIGGYNVTLNDLVGDVLKNFTAQLYVENTNLGFKKNFTLTLGHSEAGFSSDRRSDVFIADRISSEALRLRFREIDYKIKY